MTLLQRHIDFLFMVSYHTFLQYQNRKMNMGLLKYFMRNWQYNDLKEWRFSRFWIKSACVLDKIGKLDFFKDWQNRKSSCCWCQTRLIFFSDIHYYFSNYSHHSRPLKWLCRMHPNSKIMFFWSIFSHSQKTGHPVLFQLASPVHLSVIYFVT